MSRRTMLKFFIFHTLCFVHIASSLSMEVSLTAHPVKCNGGSDGAIELAVLDATGELSIKLYDRTPAVKQKTLESIITTDSIITFKALVSKKYYIVVTDSKGTYFKGEIILNEPEAFTYLGQTVKKNPTSSESNDGEVTLNLKGGTPPYTYKWGNNAKLQKTQTATKLAYGIYNCEINDANNCGPLRPAIMFLQKPENN